MRTFDIPYSIFVILLQIHIISHISNPFLCTYKAHNSEWNIRKFFEQVLDIISIYFVKTYCLFKIFCSILLINKKKCNNKWTQRLLCENLEQVYWLFNICLMCSIQSFANCVSFTNSYFALFYKPNAHCWDGFFLN